MSPKKQSNFVCATFFARISLALAVVMSIAWPATAAVVNWTGTTDDLWTTATNWSSSPLLPGSADDVTFTNTDSVATAGTVTNIVNANSTIKSLQYNNMTTTTVNTQTTQINAGVTLKIAGNVAADASFTGNYSLYVGSGVGNDAGATGVTNVTIKGDGELNITSATGGNTGGDIVVRNTSATGGATRRAILDLSGLNLLTANVDQIMVGHTASGTTAENRPSGTMFLAKHNVLTVNNTGTAIGVGVNTAGNDGNPGNLYLGQTNEIYTNGNILVSMKTGSTSNFAFNPAFLGGATEPTLVIRGLTGGTTRMGNIGIADNGSTTSSGGSGSFTGVMDLTGGTVDIMAASINVSRTRSGDASTRQANGTLSFDGGTIDTTTLNLAWQNGSTASSGVAVGTMNVSGTAILKVGTGGITMSRWISGAGGGSATSNLNISGGTVQVGTAGSGVGNITMNPISGGTVAPSTDNSLVSNLNISGGTITVEGSILKGTQQTAGISKANINLTGGTLDMTGGDIGSAAIPIDTVSFRGGSVSNLGSLYANNFSVSGPLTLAGTAQIANNGSINMWDGAGNTVAPSNLTLLGTSALYFDMSNNPSSGNDLINMPTGTLTFNGGTTSIYVAPISSGFTTGDYRLINYGTLVGTTTYAVVNNTRSNMSVTEAANQVNLHIDAVAAKALTWSGGAFGNWDLKSSFNWNSGTDQYYDGDSVSFGNTGSPTTVQLYNGANPAVVVPSSVTVNADNDYTISPTYAASDKISGATGITKQGTGTLFLNTSNDFTGAVSVQAGKLAVGAPNALGSTTAGTTVSNGATLDLNGYIVGAEPITVQGAGVDSAGAIINSNTVTGQDMRNALRYVTLTGDTTFGGNYRWDLRGTGNSLSTGGNGYSLTKVGTNQVTLVGTTVDSALANVNVTNGIFSIETTTTLGDPAKTVTVDGATTYLQFYRVSVPLNKKVVLQNGGSLYANSNNLATDNTVAGAVAIADSGGVLNAGGTRADITAPVSSAAMTISGQISGSSLATLTKTGPGTVTLSNTNPFSGATIVNDGTLAVNGSLAGSVTLQTSPTPNIITTLSGTGTVLGTTTDGYNTRISPAGNGVAGTLNLGSVVFNGYGELWADLSNNTASGNDLLNINGDLSLNNVTTLHINPINGSLANGTYHLIYYSGSELTGNAAANLTVAGVPTDSRKTYVPTDASHYINLVVSGNPLSLLWKGDGSSNLWDVAVTSNKVWLSGGPPPTTPDCFYNLDEVTFDDSGSNSPVITVGSPYAPVTVSPGSMVVNNSLKNYTFVGAGKISGSTGLTKSGTGVMILANGSGGNTNDYAGTTTINAGTLQIGDGVNFNARIGSGPIVNNGALALNSPTGDDYSIAGIISGTGTVEQKGGNTVTLSGANTYSGATTVTSGVLKAGNGAALGTTDAGTTIASGATLDINNQSLGAEPVTVGGQGVGSAGAIVNTNTATTTTPQNALRLVTLTGDTYFGGTAAINTTYPSLPGAANSGRWDIRTGGTPSVAAQLSTGGQPYNITKVGNNQVTLVGVTVDPALANVNIQSGIFSMETTSNLGDPNKTVSVASGAILQFYRLSTPLNKNVVLDGGTIFAQSNSLTTDNTIVGPIAVTDAGGILNAGGTRADNTTADANVRMTINGQISGSSIATLTKDGPGTVVLNAANPFSGTTNLLNGTLAVNGSLAGGINMSTSPTVGVMTTLSGTGSVGGTVVDAANVRISPAGNGAVGTLTLNNLTLYGSAQIYMDLSNSSSGSNDLLKVNGTLSTFGITYAWLNATGGYLQGNTSYHLIQYGSISGWSPSMMAVTGLPTDGRQTYGFATSGNYVDLVVTGSGANLTWVGDGTGNAWDIKTTPNWNGGGDNLFWNGDFVTFNDTTANTTVNINSAVSPATIVVNAGQDYTFTGAGSIINGSLTKQGTGTLTLATPGNTYSGQTKVEDGVLVLSTPISNNSQVLVTGGTLRVGVTGALGTATIGTTINGGTLDINGLNCQGEPVTVQGAGAGGNGAIVNSGVQQISALTLVTMSGDATFGGAGPPGGSGWNRWDIRGTGAQLSTSGQPYNLTKVGGNQVTFVAATIDPALANITINNGILAFQTSTNGMGDPTKTVTINSGGVLGFYQTANTMTKQAEINGGTIWAENGTGATQNFFAGPIHIGSLGAIFDAGSNLTGGTPQPTALLRLTGAITGSGNVTKGGGGTVFYLGSVAYGGSTTINDGTLQVNTPGSVTLHAVTGSATSTLGVGDGTVATSLTVDSVQVNVLNVAAGSTLTIAPLPGGPLAGVSAPSAVPEPSTWAMLALAAMGLGIYWRRSR